MARRRAAAKQLMAAAMVIWSLHCVIANETDWNGSEESYYSGASNSNYNVEINDAVSVSSPPSSVPKPLTVGLTLIRGAAAKGAVCLDGTLPGYHLHRGFGSGAKSWLIQLEGGGWCNTIRSCVYRKTTRRGSSKYMEKQLQFTGILSNKPEENPDFFNWNRVKLRYCDGASFSGDSQNKSAQLYFRGERIWLAAMEELMKLGMQKAEEALLSGCSAGGLASILHCDKFRALFPDSIKVKCLSDAGFFLDAIDVSGGRTLRNLYEGVVSVQELQKNLPSSCTSQMDPTSCFFPQNLVGSIKTPLLILNAAYDAWQLQSSLAPPSADPHGYWNECKLNHAHCNSSQIQYLQDFRDQMLNAMEVFSTSGQNGLFINSCFAHCQSERQDTWFAADSPLIGNKRIAESVGDWYFERSSVKAIDCAYPCDNTCHNLVFKSEDLPPNTNTNTMSSVTFSSQSTRFTLPVLNLLSVSLLFLACLRCTTGFHPLW